MYVMAVLLLTVSWI